MSSASVRRCVIAGNWKMNGSLSFIKSFASDLSEVVSGQELDPELLLFTPALHLLAAQTSMPSAVGLGAQNIHSETSGAFTGEQSAEMLADLGIGWTLIGHSERRSLFGETNADTAAKVAAAERAGLSAVLCLGETIDERRAGKAEAVVLEQLDAVLESVGIDWLAKGMIAYEPVWAIGTGETASPEQAQEMHGVIRQSLTRQSLNQKSLNARSVDVAAATRILYGGSMTPDNAAQLLSQPDIDGGLVGGASLTVEKFVAIARAVG